MRSSLFGWTFLVVAALGQSAWAQGRAGNIVAPEAASRNGLKPVWQTQVEMNRTRGRLLSLTQQVNSWTYLEVKVGKLSWKYSERDRNANGEMIGLATATDRANAKMADLKDNFLNPELSTQVKASVRLYAVTDRGLVHALDGETGETVWTQEVGEPRFVTSSAGANNDIIAIANGSKVYALDYRKGDLLWTRQADSAVAAGLAVSNQQVFVPDLRGFVESINAYHQDTMQSFKFRSEGKLYMQPVTNGASTAWATDSGKMYVSDGRTGRVRFRLDATSAIAGQPAFLSPRSVFAASVDGYVYCCDEMTGSMNWRYTSAGIVDEGPVAAGETVYVVTRSNELHAIDAKTGLLQTIKSAKEKEAPADPVAPPTTSQNVRRWPIVPGIKSVLAISPTRVYCLGRERQMVILDVNTGRTVSTLPIGNQDIVFHNHLTDRIFLATSTGMVQCLREEKLVEPFLHRSIEETPVETVEEKPMETEKPMTMPTVKPKPGAEDPFGSQPKNGGTPAEDPFGMEKPPAGKPMTTPKGPATPADDPFGGS